MKINIKPEKYCANGIYEGYLRSKIYSICSKIKFSCDNIEWIIYNSKEIDYSCKSIFNKKRNKYGYCDLSNNSIYISTLAIQESYMNYTKVSLGKKKNNNKNDILDKVILDELAHISSRADHGTPEYEKELKRMKKAIMDI